MPSPLTTTLLAFAAIAIPLSPVAAVVIAAVATIWELAILYSLGS